MDGKEGGGGDLGRGREGRRWEGRRRKRGCERCEVGGWRCSGPRWRGEEVGSEDAGER